MRTSLFLLGCVGLSSAAMAQLPDVAVFADLHPTIRIESGQSSAFRWIDVDGKVSTVGLRFVLENGARIKLSQRFQKVPGDPDPLDEYWISFNGEWLLGKQYIPFGRRVLLRESVPAITFNTSLAIDGVPADVCVFDAGEGLQRGVSFRLGRPTLGVSAAIGDHIGIHGTSLTPFRNPGNAPGRGRGWRTAYGADATVTIGLVNIVGEVLFLRNGETKEDDEKSLSDIRASMKLPVLGASVDAGWSRSWSNNQDVFRLGGNVPVSEKASLRPVLRFDRNGFRDFSVSCWVRL